MDESLEVKHEIFARSAVDPDTEGEQVQNLWHGKGILNSFLLDF